MADVLFTCEHVDTEIRNEYILRNSPYRIVECRIPVAQRESFLNCMDLLPAAMEYNSMTDFEDYCRNFMEKADRMLAREEAPGGGWMRGTEESARPGMRDPNGSNRLYPRDPKRGIIGGEKSEKVWIL